MCGRRVGRNRWPRSYPAAAGRGRRPQPQIRPADGGRIGRKEDPPGLQNLGVVAECCSSRATTASSPNVEVAIRSRGPRPGDECGSIDSGLATVRVPPTDKQTPREPADREFPILTPESSAEAIAVGRLQDGTADRDALDCAASANGAILGRGTVASECLSAGSTSRRLSLQGRGPPRRATTSGRTDRTACQE